MDQGTVTVRINAVLYEDSDDRNARRKPSNKKFRVLSKRGSGIGSRSEKNFSLSQSNSNNRNNSKQYRVPQSIKKILNFNKAIKSPIAGKMFMRPSEKSKVGVKASNRLYK